MTSTLLPTSYYLLPFIFCLLPLAYYLLPITYYPLPITYYLVNPFPYRKMKKIIQLLELHEIISLSIPLLERKNLIQCLAHWQAEKKRNCYLYNIGSGWQEIDSKSDNYLNQLDVGQNWHQGLLEQLNNAMQWIVEQKNGLFVLENLPSYLKQSQGLSKEILISCLQNLIWSVRNNQKTLILLLDCNENSMESSLQSLIPQFYYPLPTSSEIARLLKTEFSDYVSDEDISLSMLSSVSGLSEEEIKIGISLVKKKGFLPQLRSSSSSEITEYLQEELLNYKKKKLAMLGLEFIVPDVKDFGGLDRIKAALDAVKLDFSPSARKLGLPLPKGWLLVGPPGTGKTFSAKVCAAKLGFPLINIGIEQVKSGGVDKLKLLLNRVEAAAPAVVYFDEFDKFFVNGDGETQQVLGVLLTWLQEKKSETFAIASLNRLDALPPELTRAGRFDKLFYCGFPQASERVEILKIHCGRFDRRWLDSPPLDLQQWRVLLQKTQNCTGAELRAIAENAARQLFRLGKPLLIEFEHLLEQRSLLTPLYYRDIERILAIENRAKALCEPGSSNDLSKYAAPNVSLWGENLGNR